METNLRRSKNSHWVLEDLKTTEQKATIIHVLSRKANMNEETEHFTIVASLKACGKEKSIHKGYRLHADLLKRGLFDKSHYLASALISMYSKCSLLVEAHEILKELLFANIVSWNALISGYAQMGPCDQALMCLERMHSESISPNVVTLTCILKACATIGDIKKGKLIHGHIVDLNRGEDLSDKDIVLGIALVDMYVKCGSLLDAQRAHDELCARNVSSWSLLISGYVQDRQGHEALKCYEQMQREGIYAESGSFFVCVLKACGTIGDIDKGKRIHVEIVSRKCLLEKDIVLCNTLVDMYIKCGATAKAREILYEIPIRNVVSWNVLIGGYALQRQVQEALDCYKRMRIEGILSDIVTMIGILKACGRLGAIGKGKRIHQEIISRGLLEKDIVLGNALVDMYAKCGVLTKAQEVVDTLPSRDIFSWNTLIYGYCKHGQGHEALICFNRLQSEGLHPDEVSFTYILKACGIVGAINKGKCIHDEIVSKGLLKNNDIIGTALIDMYVKCGDLATAAQVLEDLPVRNVVGWSSLISGYVVQTEDQQALNCFESMQSEGLSPDVVAFTCILKACGNIGAIDKGKQIHKEIASKGWLSKDSVIGNAVVNMYVKCDELRKAHEVLEEIHARDHVSWNTLINGFIQHGEDHKAINCFEQMQNEGLSPNVVTFICILQACGNLGAIDKGKSIHSEIVNRDWLDKYIVLGNALLDMYAKCGMLMKAQEVFEDLHGRNIASWNAIITAFAQEPEQGRKAVNYFERLQSQLGLCPDSVTFICTLRACGNIGAIDKGIEIHDEIISKGLLEKDNALGNALVDMYAKCGMLAKAIEVMKELPVRDRVGWNALIGGYAQQGQGHEALKCFEKMQRDRVCPDEITLLSLLSACSHSGLLDDAQVLYANMTQKHNLIRNMEHHTCMVVALGYAGHFDKAMLVIQSMSSYDYLLIWLALLGSCEKWGNVELGKLAFNQTIQLDHNCAPAYALMASIFASANMQHDAQRVEVMRLKYAAGKRKRRKTS